MTVTLDSGRRPSAPLTRLTTAKAPSLLSALLPALWLSCSIGTAQAQSAGSFSARVGLTHLAPDVSSGTLSAPSFAGSRIDVDPATQVSGGLSYALTDNLVLDLPLALPFEHDIVGAGTLAGVGRLGEVKLLPVTLFGQYRFGAPKAAIRPYVGLGLTYAKFSKARSTAALTALTGGSPASPTTLSVASKWTATAQVGAVFALKDRWSLNAAVGYTPLKTRATLSTGQGLDVKLDPVSLSVEAVYAF